LLFHGREIHPSSYNNIKASTLYKISVRVRVRVCVRVCVCVCVCVCVYVLCDVTP